MPVDAHRVTGSSEHQVFVSTENAILEFDGVQWDTLLTVDSTHVVALAAGSDGSLFAGLGGDRFDLWDGSDWIDTHWPAECSYSICAFNAHDAFAVGACGGPDRIYRWDGVAWTEQASTNHYLAAIGGTNPADVFAVGLRGALLHFDGIEWQEQARLTDEHLSDVFGAPTGTVIAGRSHKVLWIEDQQPRVLRQSVPDRVFAIAAESPSRFVVSDLQTVYRFENGEFSEAPLPIDGSVLELASRRMDDVYAIVNGIHVAHHDGASWDAVDSLTTENEPLLAVWAGADGTAFASGFGAVYRHSTAWERIWEAAPDAFVYLDVITSDGDNGIVVAGESYSTATGVIMHFDGDAWTSLPGLPNDRAVAMWSGPGMDLHLAGYRAIYRWDGQRFHKIPGPIESFGSVLVGMSDGRVIGMNSRSVAVVEDDYLNVSPAEGPAVATYTPDGTIVGQVGRSIASWRP
jgi:hypothetical protein